MSSVPRWLHRPFEAVASVVLIVAVCGIDTDAVFADCRRHPGAAVEALRAVASSLPSPGGET